SNVTATCGTWRGPWLITEPNQSALAEVAPTHEAVRPVVRTTTLVRAHDTRRRTARRAAAGTAQSLRPSPAASGPRLVVTPSAAASQKSDDGPKTAMAVRPAVPARAAAVGAPASDRPASGAPSENPRSSPRRSVTGPGLAWDNSHTVATVTPPDTTTGTGLSPRRRAAQAAPAATRLPASAVTRLSGPLPAAASAGRASTATPSPATMPASGGRSAPAATGTGSAAEAAEA